MKKIIALLLSIIMVFCSLPMSAFSETLESQPIEENTEENTEATTDDVEEWHLVGEESVVTDEIIGEVSEVTALREENAKHFSLPDGTYEAVIYTQPVHRKDKDGVWQDIDNTIELTTIDKASKYATKDLRVRFADKFTANSNLFTLSENGYSLSMQLLSNGNELDDEIGTTDFGAFSTPTVNNSDNKRNANVFNSLDEAKNIDNRSSIVYNGIRKNTNIEYVLKGNDVKENIIVTAPCKSYEYVFQITLNGLFAELNDNGEIFIKDSETNDIKYIIPAPYMYDANNVYSYDVSYTLEQVKDEIYLLAVTADTEWINAEDRAFPVVVDPSINANSGIVDTYTDSAYPNNSYGSSYNLWVSNTQTTYIKLNLPELPDEAIVNTAYLYVPYYYYVSTGQLMADVYNITSNWAANTLTYNTSPTLGSLISTKTLPASASITQSSPGTAMFTITAAVKNWYKGASNYGVAIKRQNSEASTNQSVILTSSEYYPSSTYITVNYTYYIPDGVYAFQNLLYDTVWMTINDDNVWENANLKWKYSETSPIYSDVFDQSSLFKVSRVGSTSRYTIRSMLNNNITFNIIGNEIKTKEIPSIDIEVPAEDTFSINWTGDGFSISPFRNSDYIIGLPALSNNNLSPRPSSTTSTSAQWTLCKYIGAQQHGFGLYASNYPLAVGHSGYFRLAVWSTEIGYNTPDLCVHESSTERLTIDWDDTTQMGVYELLELGTAAVSCIIYNENKTNTSPNWDHFIQIIPLQPDTYYIQNVQTQKYVTSDYYNKNDDDQNISEQNISAGQWTYDNANYQRWEIEYTDSSYQYITIYSSEYSGGYLGVDQNNSTKIKQYTTVNDYCTWKIEKTRKGNFKFTCKALENNDQELVLAFGSFENGARLVQSTYQHNSTQQQADYDEWYLVKKVISIVNYYDASFENNETLKSYITEAVKFANLSYSRYFHVGIYMDGAATRKQTILDNCNKEGLNDPCDDSCGSDCSDSHHKNTVNVSDYLYNNIQRQSNHIYVLWTDRPGAYCIEDSQHTPKGSVALIYDNRPIIHFLSIPSNDRQNTQNISMSITLVHEIAHVLGLEDMYDNPNYPNHDTDERTTCVMEKLEVKDYSDFFIGVANHNKVPDRIATNNTYSHYEPFCKICKVKMIQYTSKINIQ